MKDIFADAIRGLSWGVSLAVMLSAFSVGFWIGDTFTAYDDTDNAATRQRSGMAIRTDHGTGCQYLESGLALTPRLDSKGAHICKGQ